MRIIDLIGVDGVVAGLRTTDKSQALRELSRRAASELAIGMPSVFEAVNAREALGATGVGRGVAIPHARIEGLQRLFGLFFSLERPVDFDAYDGEPVDLIFLLLSPATGSNAYLVALACISRTLCNRAIAERLRGAREPGQLYRTLAGNADLAVRV